MRCLLAILCLTWCEGIMFDLINEARADVGVAALTLDCSMTEWARYRTQQQVEWGELTHEGAMPGWGETLVLHSLGVVEAFHLLMTSPEHRDVMLDPRATRTGVGQNGWVVAQVYAYN